MLAVAQKDMKAARTHFELARLTKLHVRDPHYVYARTLAKSAAPSK
jgi:hypothetical protein